MKSIVSHVLALVMGAFLVLVTSHAPHDNQANSDALKVAAYEALEASVHELRASTALSRNLRLSIEAAQRDSALEFKSWNSATFYPTPQMERIRLADGTFRNVPYCHPQRGDVQPINLSNFVFDFMPATELWDHAPVLAAWTAEDDSTTGFTEVTSSFSSSKSVALVAFDGGAMPDTDVVELTPWEAVDLSWEGTEYTPTSGSFHFERPIALE